LTVDDARAGAQMRQLGEAYEEVVRQQAAFNAKAEAAKTAKKSLEAAHEVALALIRDFTHPKPMPLFDAPQAEADRRDMLEAVDAVDKLEDALEADAGAGAQAAV